MRLVSVTETIRKQGYNNLGWHPDLSGKELFEGPSLDGRLPFMEIKVFYVFSDLSESNSGNLWLMPGSHKRPLQEWREARGKLDLSEAVELRLKPGAAVLWRTATWHCVGPNLSDKTRKIMHVGYHYRWLRPADFIQQSPELIAKSSPIRKQLLGALAAGDNPLGASPEFQPPLSILDHKESGRCSIKGLGRSARAMKTLTCDAGSIRSTNGPK